MIRTRNIENDMMSICMIEMCGGCDYKTLSTTS